MGRESSSSCNDVVLLSRDLELWHGKQDAFIEHADWIKNEINEWLPLEADIHPWTVEPLPKPRESFSWTFHYPPITNQYATEHGTMLAAPWVEAEDETCRTSRKLKHSTQVYSSFAVSEISAVDTTALHCTAHINGIESCTAPAKRNSAVVTTGKILRRNWICSALLMHLLSFCCSSMLFFWANRSFSSTAQDQSTFDILCELMSCSLVEAKKAKRLNKGSVVTSESDANDHITIEMPCVSNSEARRNISAKRKCSEPGVSFNRAIDHAIKESWRGVVAARCGSIRLKVWTSEVLYLSYVCPPMQLWGYASYASSSRWFAGFFAWFAWLAYFAALWSSVTAAVMLFDRPDMPLAKQPRSIPFGWDIGHMENLQIKRLHDGQRLFGALQGSTALWRPDWSNAVPLTLRRLSFVSPALWQISSPN